VAIITPSSFIDLQAIGEIKNIFGKSLMIGRLHTGQEDIKIEVVNYFSNFFNE
jgi:hypothetical protein